MNTFKKSFGLSLLGLLVLGLSSCSSISKKDCETADLYKMGLEDGKDGKGPEQLNKYTEKCQEKGVPISSERYTYGRRVGLAQYCSRDRGRDDAKDGKSDSICLAERVPPYESAYIDELHKQRQEKAKKLSKIQESQQELQKEQQRLQSEMNRIEQQQSGAIQSE